MSKNNELKVYTDNGQMKVWASNSYMHMQLDSDFYDGEMTYNVHLRHLKEINNIVPGNLVSTNEGETGLVVEWISKDMQGFDVYKVMIQGKELLYSTLELAIIGE
jgi:hypothetical protein|tara:strand:+ start:502 stop:816 length:315 start_codon:yes stop_codon:yes gene_type:complete